MRAFPFTVGAPEAPAPEKISFVKASEMATKTTQNKLLDIIIEKTGLRNDAGLARLLEVAPPVISKIRHNRLPFGATLAVAATEVTDLTIADISAILAGRAPQ